MVLMPGGDENVLEVEVRGDGSDFESTMAGAQGSVLDLRTAVFGLSTALTAVAAAGFAKATTAAADYESQLVELEKTTNPQTAREMGDAIQEMAETIPLAHRELSNIAAQAGRLGIEGTESIREFTRVVSEMAISTDLTADEAANAFARITQLTGVPIDNVRALGNSINELSNTMATTSGEVVDSVLRSGAALSQLGLSASEITALGATLNEVSESSERAGTRLRSMALELQALSPTEIEPIAEAVGLSTEEFVTMRDEAPLDLIRRLAQGFADGGDGAQVLSQELSRVNQQALRGLAQNIDSLDSALETSNEQMANGSSLANEFAAATDTFNSKLQTTRNRLQNVAITTGERVLPVMSDLLTDVNRTISEFDRLNEKTDGLAGTASLAALGIGGLAGMLLTFAGGPATAAVGAAAAIGLAWERNFGGIQDSVNDAWFDIQRVLDENVPEAMTALEGLLQKGQAFWDEWGDEIEAVVGFVADVVLLGLVTTVDFVVTQITGFLQLLNGNTEGALDTWMGFWDRAIDNVGDFLAEWTDGAFNEWINTIIYGANVVGTTLEDLAGETPGFDFNFERIDRVNFGVSESGTADYSRARQQQRNMVDVRVDVRTEEGTEADVETQIDERERSRARRASRTNTVSL